jgi:hypothetical protein
LYKQQEIENLPQITGPENFWRRWMGMFMCPAVLIGVELGAHAAEFFEL